MLCKTMPPQNILRGIALPRRNAELALCCRKILCGIALPRNKERAERREGAYFM